jgi:S1-C subfamily serine protease
MQSSIQFTPNIRAVDFFQSLAFGEEISMQAAEQYLRSVTVAIFGTKEVGEERQFHHLGSGFFFDSSPHLLTCAHVIKNASDLLIKFANDPQQSYPVIVEAADIGTDLALLRIDQVSQDFRHQIDFIRILREGRIGDITYCGGYPAEAEQLEKDVKFQVTKGNFTLIPATHSYVVSNQTDHGCSGGPCVTSRINCLLGVIQDDFGRTHHQTKLIPFLDVDNFLRAHGYCMYE